MSAPNPNDPSPRPAGQPDYAELGPDDLRSVPPGTASEAPASGPDPYDPELAAAMAEPMGSDDETLKKISRRTSNVGRLAFLGIAIAVIGVVVLFFLRSQEKSTVEARLEEIGAMEDVQAIPGELRALYPKVTAPDQKARVLLNLGHFGDERAVPLMVGALDDGGLVRRDAARALAKIGPPAADVAKDKLLEVLPDTGSVDRAQVVWTLAVLGEDRASVEILEQFRMGRLQSLEGFDPKVVTETLGPTRLASDELLGHEDVSVRTLTAVALGEAATPEVVAPLTKLVEAELARDEENRSEEVIEAAVAGLGRTGDARAALPLFQVLERQPGLRSLVLAALRASVAAPGIAVLLDEAVDVELQKDLAELLAETKDPRAADALAAQLGADDPELRNIAGAGLADLGDRRATPVLVTLAQGEDDAAAQKALVSLRRLGDPAAADGLLTVLDEWPGRKAATLRALGTTGDQSVSRVLEKELESDDVRSAALALADLDSPSGYRKLVDMLPRPRNVDMSTPEVQNEELFSDRKAAVEAMGFYGKPDVVDELRTIVEDALDDGRLRSLAATSLGLVASPEEMREVVALVQKPDVEEDVRRYYVQALWQRPLPSLQPALLDLVADPVVPSEVRRAAALAVGYAGNPDNDARLRGLLENPAVQKEAAFAVALGGDPDAVEMLVDLLVESADLADLLQYNFLNEENDWFNVLTESMFDSGQVWRRYQAARRLQEGKEDDRFAFAMAKALSVMRSGWEGAGGVPPRAVRERVYQALVGEDPAIRDTAGRILGDLGERGLLLRARDAGGPGGEVARGVLRRLDT